MKKYGQKSVPVTINIEKTTYLIEINGNKEQQVMLADAFKNLANQIKCVFVVAFLIQKCKESINLCRQCL